MTFRRVVSLFFLALFLFSPYNHPLSAAEPKKTEVPRYLLAVGGDCTPEPLKIYNALTGECVKDLSSLDLGHWPIRNHTKISFSADGKRLVVPAGNRRDNPDRNGPVDTVFVIDVESGKILRDFGRESGEHADISPDGKYVVSTLYHADERGENENGNGEKYYRNDVKLWDVDTGKLLQTWKHPKDGGIPFKAISFSCDGKNVVTTRGGVAEIREIPSGRIAATLDVGGHNVCFSPDGKYLGLSRGVWDIQTGKCLYKFDTDNTSFAWSPSGKFVVAPGKNDTFCLYSSQNGELIKELSPGGKYALSVAWSPDEKYIAFAQWYTSKSVSIYDVKNDKFINRFGGGSTSALAFMPFPPEQMKIIEKQRVADELLEKGLAYLKVGQKGLAVAEFRKAATADKDSWEADFVLGLVEAYGNKNTGNAYLAFSRCEKKSQDAAVLNNLAVASALRGRYVDALTMWEKLAEKEPSPPTVVLHNVALLMDKVNKRRINSLSMAQTKRLTDLHLKLLKINPNGHDPERNWRLMPLPGVTDGKEYEAIFMKRFPSGKPNGVAYEWR